MNCCVINTNHHHMPLNKNPPWKFSAYATGCIVSLSYLIADNKHTWCLLCWCFSEIIRSYPGTQLLKAYTNHSSGSNSFDNSFSNEIERKIQIRTNMLLQRALEWTGLLDPTQFLETFHGGPETFKFCSVKWLSRHKHFNVTMHLEVHHWPPSAW